MSSTSREVVLPASASPEEAAAIVGALERFLAETSSPPSDASGQPSRWLHAARLEGLRDELPHTAWGGAAGCN